MPQHGKKELFASDYAEKAHLQKGFNPHVIDDLVDYILRVKPESQESPLRILDLACGDGGSTYLLLQRLDESGIQVESVAGYDISPSQIEVAAKWAARDSRLQFAVQDINTMSCEENFDVVLSLFGLHWMDNIHSVAGKVRQCLKPDGILMFFVPLEKNDFFALRTRLVQSEKWRAKFNDFDLKPFISESSEYLQAFSPFFILENEFGINGEQDITFLRGRFAEFLTSWMQELRHLHSLEEKEAFVSELIDLISESATKYPDVKLTKEKKIEWVERYFWLHAKNKKEQTSATVADDSLCQESCCP